MRIRLVLASLVAGTVLAGVGALAAPASAEPQQFGTCKINLLSADEGGDGITVPDTSNIIECYY